MRSTSNQGTWGYVAGLTAAFTAGTALGYTAAVYMYGRPVVATTEHAATDADTPAALPSLALDLRALQKPPLDDASSVHSPRSTISSLPPTPRSLSRNTSLGYSEVQHGNERYLQALVVRGDLGLRKNHIASQCAHACLCMFKKMHKKRDPVLKLWDECGAPKVILRAANEDELIELQRDARMRGVPTHTILDIAPANSGNPAAPRTRIVMAVGPAPCEMIKEVLTHLPQL